MSRRLNISKQLEISATGSQVLITDAITREAKYLAQGTTGQVLTEDTVAGVKWGVAGVSNAQNGTSAVAGFVEHGLNPLLHDTYLDQDIYRYRIYGDREVQIGINPNALVTDLDFPLPFLSAFDNSGRLTLYNAPKTDGSTNSFSVLYLQNNDTQTQSYIYSFLRNPPNYKQTIQDFTTLAASPIGGTTVALDTTLPFTGTSNLRITGMGVGTGATINLTLNTGQVTPAGQFVFHLNGLDTFPHISNYVVTLLCPDTSNCLIYQRSLETMVNGLWTNIVIRGSLTTGSQTGTDLPMTVVGSPDFTNITGLQIVGDTFATTQLDVDAIEYYKTGISNQFYELNYEAGERVYDYRELHPLCAGLKGENCFGGEARGGYGDTLADAINNSLKSRNYIYQSSYCDFRVYGNQIGIKLHVHIEQADTINSNPAYFNKFSSSRHQEAVLMINDCTKEVSPFKFQNRATITNPLQATNYQNSNDSVYTFFDNGNNNTVDTMRIVRGAGQLFGSAFRIDQSTTGLSDVTVFEAYVNYSSITKRGLVYKGDGKCLINGLFSNNPVIDQVRGINQPYPYLHVQGAIGRPANTYPGDFTLTDNDYYTETNTGIGNRTISLVSTAILNSCINWYVKPNSPTSTITISAFPNQLRDRGGVFTTYTAPAGYGVKIVGSIGGFYQIEDIPPLLGIKT